MCDIKPQWCVVVFDWPCLEEDALSKQFLSKACFPAVYISLHFRFQYVWKYTFKWNSYSICNDRFHMACCHQEILQKIIRNFAQLWPNFFLQNIRFQRKLARIMHRWEYVYGKSKKKLWQWTVVFLNIASRVAHP